MIKEHLEKIILENVIEIKEFGLNDLTWEKETAKKLIQSLLKEDIGILEGNVYEIKEGKFIPLYDNWACVVNENELLSEFYERSKIESLKYIEAYPVYTNEKILFSIGFTEILD